MNALTSHPSTLGRRSVLCQSLDVPRASFYRHLKSLPFKANPEEELIAKIQSIATEWPSYGYRRITAALARTGFVANRKRVLRLMREENLLCRRKRRYVATTDSKHGLAVYSNIKPHVALVRINQLWVADITYIALPNSFVYLAVVLDAYSRKAIGWALSAKIDSKLVLAALNMALAERDAPLFHHSDRGAQYASAEYVSALVSRQVQISMSRTGNPYDNAGMESFMKTVKYEAVHVNEYTCLEHARDNINHFLAKAYNQKRLHSALGYLTPEEFEQQH